MPANYDTIIDIVHFDDKHGYDADGNIIQIWNDTEHWWEPLRQYEYYTINYENSTHTINSPGHWDS